VDLLRYQTLMAQNATSQQTVATRPPWCGLPKASWFPIRPMSKAPNQSGLTNIVSPVAAAPAFTGGYRNIVQAEARRAASWW